MMRPIFSGVVSRLTLAKIISFQFFLFLILLGGGLQLVKYQAAETAAHKATRLASVTAEATRYNANRTTCGFRSLVDTAINQDRTLIRTYAKAAKDKSLNDAAIQRNETRLKGTQKHLRGLIRFRSIYSTIPPQYDCADLPKKPPPLTSQGGYKP